MTRRPQALERLREAREARAFSLEELARRVGTSRQLLHLYESGEHTPRPDMVARLCAALSVPLEFFGLPKPNPEPAPGFFRHFKSKASAKIVNALERQHVWARDSIAAIEDWVVLPDVDLPNFSPPSDPREIGDDDIERSAEALRLHWGFGSGAIRDMVKLLENKGCIVIPKLVDSEAIDGFSRWPKNGRPFIVIGCRKVSGPHQRLDAAHELAHLILHRNIDKRFLELNPDTHKLIETQAFRFAGAFLMPPSTFRMSAPIVTLDRLLLIKPQWYLSVQAMLQRAKDLRMIDDESFVRQRKLLVRRGWAKNEPLDEAISLEQPQLLANAIRTLKEHVPDYALVVRQRVGLYLGEIERYAGLVSEAEDQISVPDFDPFMRDQDQRLPLFS
jgi:Zn-dependent peptidase ImmA (M78 family)/DNA-binding XRE family transcriptional regulator